LPLIAYGLLSMLMAVFDEVLQRQANAASHCTDACVVLMMQFSILQVFALWALSKHDIGGMEYTEKTIGLTQTIGGIALLVYQVRVQQAHTDNCFGSISLTSHRITSQTSIGKAWYLRTLGQALGRNNHVQLYCNIVGSDHVALPQHLVFVQVQNLGLGCVSQYVLAVSIPAHCIAQTNSHLHGSADAVTMMGRYIVSNSCFTCVFVISSNATPNEHLGLVNGLGQTFASLTRAIGPAGGGILYASTANSGLSFPFDYRFTHLIVAGFACANAVISYFLPKTLDRDLNEEPPVVVQQSNQATKS
jgi:hypothetical protein